VAMAMAVAFTATTVTAARTAVVNEGSQARV
jgi:hypothetical protein